MSTLSVDDLVASLSSSHIGQEAIELAALQTQLAQALFGTSSQPSQSESRDCAQPCNTPTGRTPSSSFSWGQMMDVQRRPRRNTEDSMMMDDMEDERMVEDILMPSAPSSASATVPLFQQQQQQIVSRSRSQSTSRSPKSYSTSTFSGDFDFTATDPFYAAQLQAMQNHSSISSRQLQPSPFMTPQQQNNYHSILLTTSTAFSNT
ncbi:hypothetical protein C8J56DRAFT_1047029 [Mycena floridula]|nr:hypothetical protein C8J56DRAFT_1047029 [Mycena floridula]